MSVIFFTVNRYKISVADIIRSQYTDQVSMHAYYILCIALM